MSGVLSRLAQRALGGSSLRPRLGSAFEPAPPEEAGADVMDALPQPVTPALPGRASRMERPQTEEEPARPAQSAQPFAARGQLLPPRFRLAPQSLPAAAVAGRDTPPGPAIAVAEQPRHPAPQPMPPAAAPPGHHRPLLPPLPDAVALPPERVPPRRPLPEAKAPDITISIGSIEFRAPPQARPTPAASPAAPRLMSLEDYLGKGQRGRR